MKVIKIITFCLTLLGTSSAFAIICPQSLVSGFTLEHLRINTDTILFNRILNHIPVSLKQNLNFWHVIVTPQGNSCIFHLTPARPGAAARVITTAPLKVLCTDAGCNRIN